jgi:hypothetical protein
VGHGEKGAKEPKSGKYANTCYLSKKTPEWIKDKTLYIKIVSKAVAFW